jgi:hypothetical protein
VWGDPKIEGTLNAVPYLRKLGVTPENLIYKFDFRDSRFIFPVDLARMAVGGSGRSDGRLR